MNEDTTGTPGYNTPSEALSSSAPTDILANATNAIEQVLLQTINNPAERATQMAAIKKNYQQQKYGVKA